MMKRYDSGVDVRLVSKPFAKLIRVALSRVRICPAEIPDGPRRQSNVKGNQENAECVHVDYVEESIEDQEQLEKDSNGRRKPRQLNCLWWRMCPLGQEQKHGLHQGIPGSNECPTGGEDFALGRNASNSEEVIMRT